MTCKKCEKTVEFPNLPHILRKCTGCGRELRVRVPSVQAEGLRVQEGESLVIPAGFLSVSPNPLKSSGYFTRIGTQRYTEALFFGGITADRSSVMSEIERFDGECRDLLKGTDLEAACRGESDDAVLKEVMDRTKDSVQWWAFLAACFCATFSDALEEGDPSAIAWPVAGIERARSMILYKNSFEEVVFMGQSARKVIDIIYTWDNNNENDDEKFWQVTFSNNSYAISQVFAVPLVFIGESAYIGGMQVDRKNAKYVDYYTLQLPRSRLFWLRSSLQ